MRYEHPELQHRLAAEYVLGTLQGRARRRFERLLAKDENLYSKVRAWEARLTPWAAAVKPVPVRAEVWQGIERRLGFIKPAPSGGFWRWWALGSTVLAAGFALMLVLQPPAPVPVPQPPVTARVSEPAWRDLAVLSTADPAEATWIVRAREDGAVLELSGLSEVAVPAGRDLELWSLPAEGAPLSLGVIRMRDGRKAEVAVTAEGRARLEQGVALAISLEPSGGSPTGAPTGPVLYSGKLAG